MQKASLSHLGAAQGAVSNFLQASSHHLGAVQDVSSFLQAS